MNPAPDLDHVFPLSGGSAFRPPLRAPALTALIRTTPGVVLGQSAFLRAWSVRRARLDRAAAGARGAVAPQ